VLKKASKGMLKSLEKMLMKSTLDQILKERMQIVSRKPLKMEKKIEITLTICCQVSFARESKQQRNKK
jgi:hypothetical protein